ncbi:MAG: hypothetical protein MK080_01060 [Opitutales bacterium]|nr:hypothetical protein [Opitutales bacterium]NRA26193.1 hypothetical protein [Opitutales bacterium]
MTYMLHRFLLLLALILSSWTTLLSGAERVWLGMTRADLIREMGQPTSSVEGKSREILLFANGAEIQLQDGRVNRVEGMSFDQQPTTTDSIRPTQGRSTPKPKPEPESITVPEPVAEQPSPPPVEATAQDQPLPQIDLSNLNLWSEQIDGDNDSYEDYVYAYEELPLGFVLITTFLIEFIVCAVIIRIAFGMQGFPTLLHQILTISVIQSLTQTGLLYLAVYAPFLTMFKADIALSYLALITAIYMFSDVKQVATAIKIAAMAKVATWVVAYIALIAIVGLL